MTEELKKIAVFQKKEIRKTFHNGEWWFVVSDIIEVLTDSDNPGQYLRNMRNRDEELSRLMDPVKKGGGQIEHPLLLTFDTSGGPQKLLSWHTEGIFRLIQSISSKKAEPFKRWLAKTGYERVQEIENPELAQKRMKAIYRAKGYSDDWIEKRTRGIAVREELTDEWQQRGVKEGKEYSILTAEISQATFGIKPAEYKKLKGLKRENLRDHMSDLELIFTMLGEASTTEIARKEDAQGFIENHKVAVRGGGVAGRARKQLELETKQRVITDNNFLTKSKKLKDKK
ncbi:phage antirepressor protein [Candidatus Saccharibacteria bacterium RIFCSPHIGHO2_12_FULL_42_8]|nr:MAG: phage antirepressor protein [Candidatus Saccharibacteria bacterium RIFCSPHIGHO2_12_FULL_42_8]